MIRYVHVPQSYNQTLCLYKNLIKKENKILYKFYIMLTILTGLPKTREQDYIVCQEFLAKNGKKASH